MIKVLTLAALLILAMAGCAEGETGPGGVDGLSGRNVLVDDSGLGDAADGGGWMLVLPGDRAPDLWASVGAPDDLRFARFTIDQAAAEDVGGTLVAVDDGGGFAPGANGPTLLCRVPPQGSAYGCAEIDLPAAGTLVTSFGEGGFVARLEE